MCATKSDLDEAYLIRRSGSPSRVSGNMASVRSCVSNLMPETLMTTRSQSEWSCISGSNRLGYVTAPMDPPRDRRRTDLLEDRDLRTAPFPEAMLPVIPDPAVLSTGASFDLVAPHLPEAAF